MFWSKNLSPDLEHFLLDWFGFGVLVHILVEFAQVIEGVRRIGMFLPANLPQDAKRILVERLGFGVLVHGDVQLAQTIEALRRVRMFRSEHLLPDPERFLVERFGFDVVPHNLEKEPKITQSVGRLGILLAPSALCHFNRPFRNGNGLPIFTLLNQLIYLLIQYLWIIVFGQGCRARENPEANGRKYHQLPKRSPGPR